MPLVSISMYGTEIKLSRKFLCLLFATRYSKQLMRFHKTKLLILYCDKSLKINNNSTSTPTPDRTPSRKDKLHFSNVSFMVHVCNGVISDNKS